MLYAHQTRYRKLVHAISCSYFWLMNVDRGIYEMMSDLITILIDNELIIIKSRGNVQID